MAIGTRTPCARLPVDAGSHDDHDEPTQATDFEVAQTQIIDAGRADDSGPGLHARSVLVGLGALTTTYTVTLFYMLLADVWRLQHRRRWSQPLGWFGWMLMGASVADLVAQRRLINARYTRESHSQQDDHTSESMRGSPSVLVYPVGAPDAHHTTFRENRSAQYDWRHGLRGG